MKGINVKQKKVVEKKRWKFKFLIRRFA